MDQSTRRQAYKLRFEGFGGLVVRVRKPSFRGLRMLARVIRDLGGDLRGEHLDAQSRLDAWELLFDSFADALIDWDLTDRGKPVPATRKGVRGQDLDLLLEVTGVWYRQVVLAPATTAAVPESAVSESTRPAPAPAAVSAGPSPEELALLSIPVEVGNAALEDDPAEPVEVAGASA